MGCGVFARRHGTPVFLTDPTLEACRPSSEEGRTCGPTGPASPSPSDP